MNISKTFKAAALVIAAILSFSCEKPFVPELSVSDSVANFDANGGDKNITVSSNADWTVSKDADWVTTKTSGNTLTITASANEGFSARTATVTVKADALSESIKVTQLANTPSLLLDKESLTISAEGGALSIEVTSNAPWKVEAADEWLTVKTAEGNGNGTISVEVAANTVLNGRSSTITVKETVSGSSKTVAVEQDAAAPSRQTDSLALVAVYKASDGANWAKNAWDLNTPVTEWKGVKVENDRVVEVKVPTKSITKAWSIPSEIADLDAVKILSFASNSVEGEFPTAVYKMKNLEQLDLSNNNISGSLSADFGNMESLGYITMLNNKEFGGSIPAEIGQLKKLFRLNFSGTSISGAIPAELAGCESLQEFMIFNAKLSGQLPDIWDQFKNDFKILMLYGNEGLTGELPASLGTIVSSAATISYHLYNCNFTGNIPESFAKLPAGAKQIRVQGNKMEGEVPAAVKAHANWNTWKPSQYIFPQQEGYGLR